MNIRIRRAQLKMTQEELHQKSGVSRATISKMENGYIPSLRIVKKIAEVLKIDWKDFYD